MTAALILIAEGTEEMEFVITYDTLVRAGVQCTSAYVAAGPETTDTPHATCSRGVRIVPDAFFNDDIASDALSRFDAIVVPGGAKGAETISGNSRVQSLIKSFYDQGKVVGMICAGSLAALSAKLPKQQITSHPSVRSKLEKEFEYSEDPVALSGKLVTSRGPGTAFPFALTLAELLVGKSKRDEIYGPMVFPHGTPF
ncbi:DJ-1 [Punctularia strigosozonata HHB-11173 SS5]|uniref:DJ-1 n=1 Tax=Punctularia strigosozonata (strain HHB-11173) TaxID=741275 RepID=UPI0004416C70|nr:DJ-1 [Punctularia strigosozonata HHB-11173 SS5]EIN08859.1 DJ-1 [Punctularia strigosozonata HHB-11173 SS5]